jgi:hypothetical protein
VRLRCGAALSDSDLFQEKTKTRDHETQRHHSQTGTDPGEKRSLPVTMKPLSYSVDARQPFDGRHSIVTGDNGAHRISMILRKIAPIHAIGRQSTGEDG